MGMHIIPQSWHLYQKSRNLRALPLDYKKGLKQNEIMRKNAMTTERMCVQTKKTTKESNAAATVASHNVLFTLFYLK